MSREHILGCAMLVGLVLFPLAAIYGAQRMGAWWHTTSIDATTVRLRSTRTGDWYKNTGTHAVRCWYEAPYLGFTLPPSAFLMYGTGHEPLHCAPLPGDAYESWAMAMQHPVPVQFGEHW